MVAAEAQACGTPVIASEIGGLQDVIQDGHTGILIPPEDSKALSRAMYTLAVNPQLAEALGEEAAKRVSLLFNWSSIAKLMQESYEEIYNEEYSTTISDGS